MTPEGKKYDIEEFTLKVGETMFMPLLLYKTRRKISVRPSNEYEWAPIQQSKFHRDSIFMELHKDERTLQKINAGRCDGQESHSQALLTKRRSRAKVEGSV